MKRLEALLNYTIEPIWFPEDIAMLKAEISELADLADGKVQDLYRDWSKGYSNDEWQFFGINSVKAFADYLRAEVKETPP